jgi:hypothetical protein
MEQQPKWRTSTQKQTAHILRPATCTRLNTLQSSRIGSPLLLPECLLKTLPPAVIAAEGVRAATLLNRWQPACRESRPQQSGRCCCTFRSRVMHRTAVSCLPAESCILFASICCRDIVRHIVRICCRLLRCCYMPAAAKMLLATAPLLASAALNW